MDEFNTEEQLMEGGESNISEREAKKQEIIYQKNLEAAKRALSNLRYQEKQPNGTILNKKVPQSTVDELAKAAAEQAKGGSVTIAQAIHNQKQKWAESHKTPELGNFKTEEEATATRQAEAERDKSYMEGTGDKHEINASAGSKSLTQPQRVNKSAKLNNLLGVEAKEDGSVAINGDPNKVFDDGTGGGHTFQEVYDTLKGKGLTDQQIYDWMKGSKWADEGTKASEWMKSKQDEWSKNVTASKEENKEKENALTKMGKVLSKVNLSDSMKTAMANEIAEKGKVEPPEEGSTDESDGKDGGDQSSAIDPNKSTKDDQEAFLKTWKSTHPTIFHAVFSKDSPLSFGERISLALSAIGTAGMNVVGGMRAGYTGGSFEPVKSEWQKAQEDYMSKGMEGVLGKRLDTKGDIESKSIITDLRKNDPQAFEDMVNSDILFNSDTAEEYAKNLGISGNVKEMAEMYNEAELTKLKSSTEEEKQKIYSQYDNQIKENNKIISELKLALSKVDINNYKDIVDAVSGWIGQAKGVNTSHGEGGTAAGISGSASGKVPFVSATISGNYSYTSSGGSAIDHSAMKELEAAKRKATSMTRASASDVQAYKNQLKKEIKALEDMNKDLIKRRNKWATKVEDGFIKGKGVSQKLVRSDGTVINLNKNDNIIATTDDIGGKADITKFDKGSFEEIMNKLGYDKKPISKNNDEYLKKLRG